MYEIERLFTKLENEEYYQTLERIRTLEEYETECVGVYLNNKGRLEYQEIPITNGEENLYIYEYFHDGKWEEIETVKGYDNMIEFIKELENTEEYWGI